MNEGDDVKVDWSQSGEVIENLVAVLLRSENPAATQIRPSQGDGGIDVRAPLVGGGVEIFQIKKFNSTLNDSQMGQIRGSYERLNTYCLKSGLEVRAWHLLMPLNPTKENHEWFDELTKAAPYPCDWRGRDYLDGLAARYPHVVDYYLHDGADRVERAVGQLLGLLKMKADAEGAGAITPSQLADQLRELQPLLDTDPHFRFGISLEPTMPDPSTLGSGFVAAISSCSSDGAGGAVTVKVYPRFAEALDFRPIPGTLTFKVEPGSAAADDIQRFLKFGAPLEVPHGSAAGTVDLPGGLGTSFEGAAVKIGPAAGAEQFAPRRLRLATIDPSGATVAELLLELQPASVGLTGNGFHTVGNDVDQVVDVELTGDLDEKSINFRISERDLAGRSPLEVLKAIRFWASFRSPNVLAVAQPHGPISGQKFDLPGAVSGPDQEGVDRKRLVVEALAVIQENTPIQIVIPEGDFITDDAIGAWLSAARLLGGETVTIGEFSARVCMHPGADVPTEPQAFALQSELSVSIGTLRVDLGHQVTHIPVAEVVPGSVVAHDDHNDVTFQSVQGNPATMQLVASPSSP